MMRSIVWGASLEWRVASTRCPVSAAVSADAGATGTDQLKAKLHTEAQIAVQDELIEGKGKQKHQPVTTSVEQEPAMDDRRRLPAYKWSPVFHSLRPFLRPCGEPGEGRLDFYHRAVSKSVRLKYLTKQTVRSDTPF